MIFLGIKSEYELIDACKNIIDYHKNNDNTFINDIYSKNKYYLSEWFHYIKEDIYRIGHMNTKEKQISDIRAKILEAIELSQIRKALVNKKFSLSEKQKIAKILFNDVNYEDAKALATQGIVFNEITCICFRYILYKYYKGTVENDWFALYVDLYTPYARLMHSCMIDSESPLTPFLPYLREHIDGIKTKIIQGDNWDYDRKELEKTYEDIAKDTL